MNSSKVPSNFHEYEQKLIFQYMQLDSFLDCEITHNEGEFKLYHFRTNDGNFVKQVGCIQSMKEDVSFTWRSESDFEDDMAKTRTRISELEQSIKSVYGPSYKSCRTDFVELKRHYDEYNDEDIKYVLAHKGGNLLSKDDRVYLENKAFFDPILAELDALGTHCLNLVHESVYRIPNKEYHDVRLFALDYLISAPPGVVTREELIQKFEQVKSNL